MKDKNILIVDDSAFDRNLLSKLISRKFQCNIIEASSGDEGLKILEMQPIDIVLLDVEMDNVSGDEVVSKIRASQTLENIPVIMVSGKSQNEIVVKCLKSGANDYISKPINFEVAMVRILNHLKLSESSKDQAKLQELAALNAMVVTYNHEINNPLTIAIASLAQLSRKRDDDAAFMRLEKALIRIAEIVKSIKEVGDGGEISYELYSGDKKMVKIG